MSETVQSLLRSGAAQLAPYSETAYQDAMLLLAAVLRQPTTFLYQHPEQLLTPEQQQQFTGLLQRRQQGVPVAYLIGEAGFWDFTLQVNPNVLIPRPETELLVEIILAKYDATTALHLADLGTGSGAIAIALARARPNWQVIATDISSAALAVAAANAARLNIATIEFRQGRWCEALPALKLDVIISNPPYLAANDPHLMQGGLRCEPYAALVAAEEGLADLRQLIQSAPAYLKPNGMLLLEHGYTQGAAVRQLLQQQGYHSVETWQDLNRHERASCGIL